MKYLPLVLGLILISGFATLPAAAFQAKTLTITVGDTGDAQVDFTYQLTWLEQAAVFVKLVDPAQELKSAIENNFYANVSVDQVKNDETLLTVDSFATIKETPEGMTYSTPALSFQNAERALKEYWFAPLINPDFSPDTTRVTFPDGYFEESSGAISIPAISHTVNG